MFSSIIALLPSTRPPFLLLAPISVLFAASLVSYQGLAIDTNLLILTLVGAVLSLVSVNCLNEYQDNQSGLDHQTQRTPFSGGSGLLQKRPELSSKVLQLAIGSAAISFLIGCYFVYHVGLAIIPIGLLGLTIIWLYTSVLNRSALACLIAPGTGLALLSILGSYYVLTGSLFHPALSLMLIPFFQINNLLLVNQYPDIDADKACGRNHFPIRFGIKKSNLVYALFLLLTTITLCLSIIKLHLPNSLWFALVPISIGFYTLVGLTRLGANIAEQPKYMAANVASTLASPLTISVILFNY